MFGKIRAMNGRFWGKCKQQHGQDGVQKGEIVCGKA
jgi:hypothetical protein